MSLRKRIIKLETDLMETVSKLNDKSSGEEAVMSRLRTLLEKSEASRHKTEYDLLVEQKQGRELREELEAAEERQCREVSRYKGNIPSTPTVHSSAEYPTLHPTSRGPC
eukprot:sb/3477430/